MAALLTWTGNGTAIDWILGVLVLEGVLLVAYRRVTQQGLGIGPVLSLLLPGACLLLALRCALTGAAPVWIAAWLLAAFFTHLADIALRWRAAAESQV